MSQLLPPLKLDHSLPKHVSRDQCIAMWIDLVDTTDKMMLAGLRRIVGVEGDLRAAYRRWQMDHRADHDKAIDRLVKRLTQLKD